MIRETYVQDESFGHPVRRSLPQVGRIAVVSWTGNIGGAEVFSTRLSKALQKLGANVGVLFIGRSGELGDYLDASAVPFQVMGLNRGSEIVRRSRSFADAVTRCGADTAILPSCGYMAAVLRAGGYRGTIIGVEHGSLLHEGQMSVASRLRESLSRIVGAHAADGLVCVSEYVRDVAMIHSHPPLMQAIYNGVDIDEFFPRREAPPRGAVLEVGAAGRLVGGKGFEVLIKALAHTDSCCPMRLRIAGDGPERQALEMLAQGHDSVDVEFMGHVPHMPEFWRNCHVAVVPSHGVQEAFGMVAIEAMASGLPVIASNNGGLPEVVEHGRSGLVVSPGSVEELSAALASYALDEELRSAHGIGALSRVQLQFSIGDCARKYIEFAGRLKQADS